MPEKHSNFLLVFYNFFIAGVLPYFVGCLGWIALFDFSNISLIGCWRIEDLYLL